MAGMVQDVTERRPADATLREAHNRITAILASIADAFYSLDDQWRRSRAPSGPMRS
jgi:PAS domain-containing protein